MSPNDSLFNLPNKRFHKSQIWVYDDHINQKITFFPKNQPIKIDKLFRVFDFQKNVTILISRCLNNHLTNFKIPSNKKLFFINVA